MTAPHDGARGDKRKSYLLDAAEQRAEHDSAIRAESWDRNDWPDDNRPTKAELDRDEAGEL